MDDNKVSELLSRALSAVDTAKVPTDLREVAFSTAIAMLTDGHIGAASPPSPPTEQQETNGKFSSSGSQLLDTIAKKLEVEPAIVRRLFAEKDGEPELIVKSSKLPKSKSAAAPDIALLVMAGRQAGGIEDYTESSVLREAAKHYGKFDQANFATQMKSLDNYILTDGKGVSMKRKLTHPGIEASVALIEKYATAD